MPYGIRLRLVKNKPCYFFFFFLGRGFEVEIKNIVKMFESKALKHAYNLARLQPNTLAYKKILRVSY